ncbi:MAG TPA: Ku protein [Dissulfurispiraceae bacterium]|nr:Ku protein [Dissulfurispiraceae bacterium]
MKTGKPAAPPQASPTKHAEASAHAIWSGTITFSLVAIPVQLVRAVEPGRLAFHLLHAKDYSPLARRMYCPAEQRIVPPHEIVRGYEIGQDHFILMTDAELESVSPERSRTIEIVEFVDLSEVDSIYYDHPYYLVPQRGGEKAYGLLVEVLTRTNKAGLAKFVLAEREYLVAVRGAEGTLSVLTLHYPEEILSAVDIASQEEESDIQEKDEIMKQVRQMITGFQPDKYIDIRRKRISDLLRKKAKKRALVEAPEVDEVEDEAPVDLVAALKESIRKVKRTGESNNR